jgi:hypothetical protein
LSEFAGEVIKNLLAVIHADRKESWSRKSAVQTLNLHFDLRQRDVDTGNKVRMEHPLFALIDRLAKNPPGILRCDCLALWNVRVPLKRWHNAALIPEKVEQITDESQASRRLSYLQQMTKY